MKQRIIERRDEYGKATQTVVARMPERADVDNLKVGDLAPDSFGGLNKVTRISYRTTTPSGNRCVGYITAMSARDTEANGCGCGCSQSMVENKLICSVALTGLLTSAECDDLELEMENDVRAIQPGCQSFWCAIKIPVVENIHSKVLAAIQNGGALEMGSWHSCGTTHCRGGWAINIAGEAGLKLEGKTSSEFAAMAIYSASSKIKVSPVRFYEPNEKAMADIIRCAKEEKEVV